MKKYLIGIGSILVIGLLILAYRMTAPAQPAATPPAEQTVGLPVAPSVETATSAPVQGGVISTGGIQTLDFIHDPATVKDPINPGFYYLGYHQYEGVTDPTASASPPYIIAYESDTQSFNIALLQEPIGPMREEMQQYLMTHLGITQDQMCRLSYMVSVPDRVSSRYAGRNLGFSFCPGATALPK